MPRSLIWPADAAEADQPAGLFFPDAGLAPPQVSPSWLPRTMSRRRRQHPPADRGSRDPEEAAAHDGLPSPNAALDVAEAALEAGDLSTAAVHLAIVLPRGLDRLAPAVLEAAGRAAGPSPGFDLVRGDAYRLLGHERDAQHAYTAAAAALTARAERRARNQEAPGLNGPLVLIKLDGVQRLPTGRILARFEERGLKSSGSSSSRSTVTLPSATTPCTGSARSSAAIRN